MIECATCGAMVVIKYRGWSYGGLEEGASVDQILCEADGDGPRQHVDLRCKSDRDHACGWSIEDDKIVVAPWVRERSERSDAGSEQIAETD